jgi:tetratricopeptide (TPR) repeat protein
MHVPSTLPPVWNVPYQRNLFFTGREETLNHLHTALCAANAVALSHPQGISGLGGIGKTQTALEYAYHYGAEYHAVCWVRANSTAALIASFVDLAHLLEIPERSERDQHLIVEAVLRWLHHHRGWLLIFDNMDDLSVAEPFLPKAGAGHIVFTTRAHALGGIAQCLEVQQMEAETGALLLLRRASILPLHISLEMALADDRKMACEISRALDGLPLALDQAGAYIQEVPCTLKDYLRLHQTRRHDLLQARGSDDKDYPASVATTWSLSFEKVHQASLAAAELLDLCAFLAPDAIPEEVLTRGSAHLGAILSPVATDPVQLDLASKEALRFSLVHREADARTLTMHRLVQAVLQENVPPEMCACWKQRAVGAVNAAFPPVEFEHWTDCERLLPHALLCAAWIEQDPTIPGAAHLLNEAGYYLGEHARYAEAEPLMEQALTIKKQQLDVEHPSTATGMNNLAEIYESQGKYQEAEPLIKQSLAIYKKQLGAEHPQTATAMNNLAGLYESQGRYEEAEPNYGTVPLTGEKGGETCIW